MTRPSLSWRQAARSIPRQVAVDGTFGLATGALPDISQDVGNLGEGMFASHTSLPPALLNGMADGGLQRSGPDPTEQINLTGQPSVQIPASF